MSREIVEFLGRIDASLEIKVPPQRDFLSTAIYFSA